LTGSVQPGSAAVPARAKSTRRWSVISVSVPTVERAPREIEFWSTRSPARALDRLDVGLLHAPRNWRA
jgi:hypothetical protein